MPDRRDFLKGAGAAAAGGVAVLGSGATATADRPDILVGQLPPRKYVLLSLDRSTINFYSPDPNEDDKKK